MRAQEVAAITAAPGLLQPGAEAMLPGAAAGSNALTRRAGGARPRRPPAVRLVVDVREFMSPLPSVLHLQGLQIAPVTLEARTGRAVLSVLG